MMIRILYKTALAALLLVLSAGSAVAGGRIALLISSDDPPYKEAFAGFNEYLGKQGFQAGYELMSLDGNSAKAGAAIQKIKQGGFSLVLTLGSLATDAAVKSIHDVPVVAGLILKTDILRKTSNATGVGLEFPLQTQFSWMKKMLPQTHTIGVLYSAQENGRTIEAAEKAAQKLGLTLEPQEVSGPQDVPAALDRLSQKADVLWGIADAVVLTPQTARSILMFSYQNRIPFIGPSTTWTKAGGLYSLDCDYRDIGAQCGEMALKILRGAAPQEVPSEGPRTVKYSLNMNAARLLKVTVADELRRGAAFTY